MCVCLCASQVWLFDNRHIAEVAILQLGRNRKVASLTMPGQGGWRYIYAADLGKLPHSSFNPQYFGKQKPSCLRANESARIANKRAGRERRLYWTAVACLQLVRAKVIASHFVAIDRKQYNLVACSMRYLFAMVATDGNVFNSKVLELKSSALGNHGVEALDSFCFFFC